MKNKNRNYTAAHSRRLYPLDAAIGSEKQKMHSNSAPGAEKAGRNTVNEPAPGDRNMP